MNLPKAVTLTLGKLSESLVTRYRLGCIVSEFYLSKSFGGQSLDQLEKTNANPTDLNRIIRSLEASGVLQDHPNFRGKVYRLIGTSEKTVEDVVCIVDPFCYVSHLSAMSYHGLTNRLPVNLILSSPDSKQWAKLAETQMRKDLGDSFEMYREEGMPLLACPKLTKIGKTEIHRINTTRLGAFKNIRGRNMRVSTIGRTFLDMLENPELCGGIRHVIEVFENEALTYLTPIVYEFNEYGRPIDKVRAGYILNERLGIQNDTIEQWVKLAARGGSRKLDATEEYFPKWSEKWCLSLNLDLPEKL